MVRRRHVRKSKKTPKRVATSRMPAGLKRFWKAVNAGHRADPHTVRKKVHRG